MSWTPPRVQLTLPTDISISVHGTPPTVVAADAYFLTSFNGAAWAALTVGQKDLALKEAYRWLDTLCWKKEDCCGRDFEQAFLAAAAELALALHTNPTAIIGAPSSGTTGEVKRVKLGDLEQEFFQAREGATSTGRVGSKAPLVLQRFPFLYDMLSCWIHGSWGSSGVIARYRS
jgi:hypothetical protein